MECRQCPWRLKPETVGKDTHLISFCGLAKLPSALAEFCKDRSMTADNVFEIHFGHAAVLVADENGGAGNVLEARVRYPKLIGIVRIDGDSCRYIFELVVYQSECRFVLADGGFALTVKGGIDESELPVRRRFTGHYAKLAAVKMKILGLVANLVNAGKSRANIEVDVAEIGVLSRMEADRHSAPIARPNFKIDVAHRRIEGAGIGVGHCMVRRNNSWRRWRHVEAQQWNAPLNNGSGVRTRTCEEEHVGDAILITRRVFAKNKDRAMAAVPDHANAGPEINGPRNPVAALGNKDNSLAPGLLELVDGSLDGQAVIRLPVALNVKVLGG